ncbi:hypothetical protein RRG08_012473 [Elysia crispata]|uniref:Uncharacterized protein n=1 Tax=Elysia crispata TaxID=231223 RepID=A0AAE1ANU4_9GAST|nr:hypothetical protein RRG08_012473 [Elysia crispata]
MVTGSTSFWSTCWSLWASQDTHLRTNSACEAFPSHFAKSFKSPQPNVFEFIDNLMRRFDIGLKCDKDQYRYPPHGSHPKETDCVKRKEARFFNTKRRP